MMQEPINAAVPTKYTNVYQIPGYKSVCELYSL